MTDEIVEGEVLSETPAPKRPKAAKPKKVAWYKKLEQGDKYRHHERSNWVYIALMLANVIGLLLIWTPIGNDAQTRWIGLNLVLGLDVFVTIWALISKFKVAGRKLSLVSKENRMQMWVSAVLSMLALVSINFSVLQAIGLGNAFLAWPATVALLVGLWLDVDAFRDYRGVYEDEETEDDSDEF